MGSRGRLVEIYHSAYSNLMRSYDCIGFLVHHISLTSHLLVDRQSVILQNMWLELVPLVLFFK